MGIFPRAGGHVLAQVPPEEGWLSGRCAELPAGHRGLDAGYEPPEEGWHAFFGSWLGFLLTVFLGPRIAASDHDHTSHDHPTARHHALPCPVDTSRLAPATEPLAPEHQEESHRHSLPASPRLPRNPEGGLAQDQGASDGQG